MLAVLMPVFAFIGLVWSVLFVLGWIINGMQMLVAKDQWLATCLIPGAYADETISAWAHRTQRKRTEAFINWLFNDPFHCARAYVNEINRVDNSPTYRKEQ